MATATKIDFGKLYADAHAAGMAAGQAISPEPMVVYDTHTGHTYAPIADGVCGFAWVKVKANTPFGRYLRKERGATPAYGGGYNIRVHAFGQSYERKMAYAAAFAGVLSDAGITAYPQGRLD